MVFSISGKGMIFYTSRDLKTWEKLTLRTRQSDVAEAWLNGVQVVREGSDGSKERAHPLHLNAGVNTLTFRLGILGGKPYFAAGLTDPAGGELQGLQYTLGPVTSR
jgi:hypothetical protein